MGEEGDDRPGTSGLRWVVDPLDGTVNFLYGIPQWCVSIAVEDAGGGVAGVVYDAMRDETWTATRSGPPALNGEVVHAATKDDSRPRWSRRGSATTPGCGRSRRA